MPRFNRINATSLVAWPKWFHVKNQHGRQALSQLFRREDKNIVLQVQKWMQCVNCGLLSAAWLLPDLEWAIEETSMKLPGSWPCRTKGRLALFSDSPAFGRCVYIPDIERVLLCSHAHQQRRRKPKRQSDLLAAWAPSIRRRHLSFCRHCLGFQTTRCSLFSLPNNKNQDWYSPP